MYFDDSPYAGQVLFEPHEAKKIPETKAISNAMASFLFIEIKFDLQSNAFFPELLPSLQRFFCDVECFDSRSPLNNRITEQLTTEKDGSKKAQYR